MISFSTPREVEVRRPISSFVAAYATCSDALAGVIPDGDDDGDDTVNCPAGYIAVGGGGACESGLLSRSRPVPDANLSKPTGWRVSCTSGPVLSRVNCVEEELNYDFRGCYTKRKDENDFGAFAICNSGDYAVAVGAYCGSSPIDYMTIVSGSTAVGCQGSTVHAYAVCCPDAG